MITPTSITKFDRTDGELELFWLFGLLVAGKNSDWAANKLMSMFKGVESPFQFLRTHEHSLHNYLVANKVGQYTRLERAFQQSLSLDLRNATLEQLMSVFGVGPKTARFFLLHSRKDCQHIVLDTHVLRYLRERWKMENVPTSTPSEAEYGRIERIAVNLIRADFPKLSLAEADLLIWSKMSGRLD